jgi:hypothetical protein
MPEPPEPNILYTELEQRYCERFLALFARVEAQQPEKGIRTLIARARTLALESGQSLEVALELVYQEALERTERRLALISQCPTRQKHPD